MSSLAGNDNYNSMADDEKNLARYNSDSPFFAAMMEEKRNNHIPDDPNYDAHMAQDVSDKIIAAGIDAIRDALKHPHKAMRQFIDPEPVTRGMAQSLTGYLEKELMALELGYREGIDGGRYSLDWQYEYPPMDDDEVGIDMDMLPNELSAGELRDLDNTVEEDLSDELTEADVLELEEIAEVQEITEHPQPTQEPTHALTDYVPIQEPISPRVEAPNTDFELNFPPDVMAVLSPEQLDKLKANFAAGLVAFHNKAGDVVMVVPPDKVDKVRDKLATNVGGMLKPPEHGKVLYIANCSGFTINF